MLLFNKQEILEFQKEKEKKITLTGLQPLTFNFDFHRRRILTALLNHPQQDYLVLFIPSIICQNNQHSYWLYRTRQIIKFHVTSAKHTYLVHHFYTNVEPGPRCYKMNCIVFVYWTAHSSPCSQNFFFAISLLIWQSDLLPQVQMWVL